jgi:hypothetical protein
LGNASFAAYYYPKPSNGLFLRGGLGVSTISATGVNSETGAGATIGAGYDLRVGGNTSITPVLNWVWGKPQSGFNHNFYQFAVGVTFH